MKYNYFNSMNGYADLGSAIVAKAIEDYSSALKHLNIKEISELKEFFNSEYCLLLTDMNIPVLKYQVEKHYKFVLSTTGEEVKILNELQFKEVYRIFNGSIPDKYNKNPLLNCKVGSNPIILYKNEIKVIEL